jgi:hypothetical protein
MHAKECCVDECRTRPYTICIRHLHYMRHSLSSPWSLEHAQAAPSMRLGRSSIRATFRRPATIGRRLCNYRLYGLYIRIAV